MKKLNNIKTYTIIISQYNMDTRRLLQRFPEFAKPSYETVVHKKVSEDYDIEVAIPFGKRAFIWFTFMGKDNICCIITVGKNNQLQDNIHFVPWNFSQEFAYGTLLSGYVTDIEETDDCDSTKKVFIVDDLFCYKGYEFGNPFPCVFQKKIPYLSSFHKECIPLFKDPCFRVYSIVMWNRSNGEMPNQWKEQIGYNTKYVQYKSSHKVIPHLNLLKKSLIEDDEYVPEKKNNVWNSIIHVPFLQLDIKSKLYQGKVLFVVRADVLYDVYYLYAKNDEIFQYAFIPDLSTSVMMNKLFRKIPENINLDLVEESEDEDTFENISENKYTCTEKRILMECKFNFKFKKWIPIRERPMHLKKYVPEINDLVFDGVSKTKMYHKHIHNARHSKQQSKPSKSISR